MSIIKILRVVALTGISAFLMLLISCDEKKTDEVVVYVSVDQVYSEPILKDFENTTGIKVLPVYDVEAAKTTGLVNRLIAEKDYPKADVFWNGEFVQTIFIKEKGVLEQYKSPNSSDILENLKDSENYWTGFGGRARVLIVNKNLIKPEEYPKSIYDLLKTKHPSNKIGIANPVFGTTATHVAAIYAQIGKEKGYNFFKQLKEKGIQVVDGNSVVRDMVVNGQLIMGLTDTDDAGAAVKKGHPVEMVFLDQQEKEMGTLVTPNTVAKIKGCKHSKQAEKLIDYILSIETETKLLKSGWFDLSLRSKESNSLKVKSMSLDLNDICKNLEESKRDMTEIFVR